MIKINLYACEIPSRGILQIAETSYRLGDKTQENN